jgi:hypothetical protein
MLDIRLEDRVDPSDKVSKTLNSEAKRLQPYSDVALPKRKNDLSDQELPIATLSRTDKLAAS